MSGAAPNPTLANGPDRASWQARPGSLLIGIGLGLGQPLTISTAIALSPAKKEGEVLGVRLAFHRLTQVVAPLAFGGLVLLTGVPGTFLAVGAVLIACTPRLFIPDAET